MSATYKKLGSVWFFARIVITAPSIPRRPHEQYCSLQRRIALPTEPHLLLLPMGEDKEKCMVREFLQLQLPAPVVAIMLVMLSS